MLLCVYSFFTVLLVYILSYAASGVIKNVNDDDRPIRMYDYYV